MHAARLRARLASIVLSSGDATTMRRAMTSAVAAAVAGDLPVALRILANLSAAGPEFAQSESRSGSDHLRPRIEERSSDTPERRIETGADARTEVTTRGGALRCADRRAPTPTPSLRPRRHRPRRCRVGGSLGRGRWRPAPHGALP